MTSKILTGNKMPFCPGCGHRVAVNKLSKALIELDCDPLNIIIVSDIGCSGLVDPLFKTHTVHGLHGRSPALGIGISMGLSDKNKKVIVVQGDGGATIGLQHIMEAARRNIDITLLIFNNLLYGMTGGQISGLSSQKFKELRHFEEDIPPFDVISLAHQAGAASSARVISPKNFVEYMKNAIQTKGFSILELASVCPSYGISKLEDLKDITEKSVHLMNDRKLPSLVYSNSKSLFNSTQEIISEFDSKIKDKVGFVLAGSAGGGVQSAAKILAQAGMMSGLHVSMKGEYPVTVGTGFSVAEVIISQKPVHYTGLENPDIMIVVSDEGLQKVKNKTAQTRNLFIDQELDYLVDTPSSISGPFRKNGGKKGAMINALWFALSKLELLDTRALLKAISEHKHSKKLLKAIDIRVMNH